MFGVLTDDEDKPRSQWGRFAGRRIVGRTAFRDVDWGALAVASVNLTAGIVGAVAHGQQPNTQSGYPSAQYQCPQGYVYNPSTGVCEQAGGSSFLSSIDSTTLLIGGGLLVLLLTQSQPKGP